MCKRAGTRLVARRREEPAARMMVHQACVREQTSAPRAPRGAGAALLLPPNPREGMHSPRGEAAGRKALEANAMLKHLQKVCPLNSRE